MLFGLKTRIKKSQAICKSFSKYFQEIVDNFVAFFKKLLKVKTLHNSTIKFSRVFSKLSGFEIK